MKLRAKLTALLFVLCLATPALAGDIESPGVVGPDPIVQIIIAVIQALSSVLP